MPDIQYKDQLRKDLIEYELLIELLKKGENEKVLEILEKHVDRTNSSLQD